MEVKTDLTRHGKGKEMGFELGKNFRRNFPHKFSGKTVIHSTVYAPSFIRSISF